MEVHSNIDLSQETKKIFQINNLTPHIIELEEAEQTNKKQQEKHLNTTHDKAMALTYIHTYIKNKSMVSLKYLQTKFITASGIIEQLK